jgi:hypothetical protein
MKINHLGVANTSLPSPLQVEEAGAGDSTIQGAAAGAEGYVPSTALVQLLHLVRQQPEVRAERVQAATERLGQGYYHTQASAENTAAARLNTLD